MNIFSGIRSVYDAANAVIQKLGIGPEHPNSTVSRAIIDKTGAIVFGGDSTPVPFFATATLHSASALTPVAILPDNSVPSARKVVVTGFVAKVNGSTAWPTPNAGTQQVTTAVVVAASGATSNGNLPVTVTGAGIAGSPLAVSVALTTAANTASLVAALIRAALSATGAITALYTVGGTGANVSLTAIAPAANDATLNIAWTTTLGVTAVTTSAATTAGVAIVLGSTKVTLEDTNGTPVEFFEIAQSALTGNAEVRPGTSGVTSETGYLMGSGGTKGKGLQIVGTANGTGSDLVVTVQGFLV